MKKTSALALAIAGTIAAPAVMAESGYYMSARLGVELEGSDVAADEALTFGDKSSRMGWRMETDLGNGKTAYGKFEVKMSNFSTRDLFVGLKGDFGDVKIAQNGYAAYYNHVSGPVDQPYWAPVVGIGDGNSRTANFISYSGGSGAFSFEGTIEANGTDTTTTDGNTSLSGYQVGATIALGDWNLGLGARNAEDSTEATLGTVSGVTVSGNVGDIGLAVSFSQDDDNTGAQIWAGFGSFWAEYSQNDNDPTDTTPTAISLGWSTSLGRNTTFWAEYGSTDSDGGTDTDVLIGTLRYDWK